MLKEISKDREFDLKDERGEAIVLVIAMGSNRGLTWAAQWVKWAGFGCQDSAHWGRI
jgi:hypothetical protein